MIAGLVSIVIPCYRGTKYLRAAIESCLRQTYPQIELIVVDDCSPDGDAAIADEYAAVDERVHVVRQSKNGGICRALNAGYAIARGEYFTRLAQDDLFREDAIQILVNGLRQCPAAGLVYCDMHLIDADGKFMQVMPTAAPEHALLPCNRVGLCVMWPRAVFERVGGFDPRFTLAEDYEFFLRISREFPLQRCGDEAPFYFRYHAGQASITQERRHEMAAARVLIAHNSALLRKNWLAPRLWKRVVTGRIRLVAARLNLSHSRANN